MSAASHNSLHYLAQSISSAIDKGAINQPLRLIHDIVEHIITEPLCTSQVYGSKILDDLCQKIGKYNLKTINENSAHVSNYNQNQQVFIYVVTKLQKSGGHTRVIEDFINARPYGQHLILSTELYGRSDIGYIKNGLAGQPNVNFEAAPRGNFQHRLTWLQKRLMEIGPEQVYLFNHHQDSVAVAAIQPEMELDASFYHHGDHHLCLGVYLSHLEHIDPHPMGYHNCREILGLKNTYIPLTTDDKGGRRPERPFMENGYLTTCTAARSNKVEIAYFVSYLDVVPAMLSATGGKHVHIGRLTPWALFRIHRALKRARIPKDRFVYVPWVPSVWKALHEFEIDLYIASFPYGGGLTLIEAMGAGIPVALHQHFYSRVLSGIDLAYTDAFCWRYSEQLIQYCCDIQPESLSTQSSLSRNQYVGFHRREILDEILDGSKAIIAPPELTSRFAPQMDEWACWAENQLSLQHVVHRGIYRFFRKIRAIFL